LYGIPATWPVPLATVTLSGRLVRLEPLKPDHQAELNQIASDARIWTYLTSFAGDPQAMDVYLRHALRDYQSGAALPFVIRRLSTGTVLGMARLKEMSREHRRAEVGTWLSPNAWGSGANTESKLLILEHAFQSLGCQRIEFRTDSRNIRSRAALARLGAVEEGTLRRDQITRTGALRDTVLFSVIDRDWPHVRCVIQARMRARNTLTASSHQSSPVSQTTLALKDRHRHESCAGHIRPVNCLRQVLPGLSASHMLANARKRVLEALRIIGLSLSFSLMAVSALASAHPQQITANGKIYNWPKTPVVVVLIDGGDPAYVNAALARGLLPNFKKLMSQGYASVAQGVMPSFTNPNNVSVITGVLPDRHGISGNFFLDPATGEGVMMNDPNFLRAESVLAKFSENGAKVVAISAKDKLSKILAYKLQNGISFSAEKADRCTKPINGIDNCLAYVGRPLPSEYSAELSTFVLEAGIKILEREKPDLMYLSLSDYVQHKYAPGSKEANEFYVAIDNALGRLAALGAIIAVTADHGMNDKCGPDGSPNIVFLQDVLDQEFGGKTTKVILPITDPYVLHHAALGSYATIYFEQALSPIAVMKVLHRQPGVELVLDRTSAAKSFALPKDRIGDLIVVSDRSTVLGASKATLDLSQLGGTQLRSHGGLADRDVYLMFSLPLNDTYAHIAISRVLHNYEVFDFALNGLQGR
jgi:phosphonoacetate hydrolase